MDSDFYSLEVIVALYLASLKGGNFYGAYLDSQKKNNLKWVLPQDRNAVLGKLERNDSSYCR